MTEKGQYKVHAHQTMSEIAVAKLATQEGTATNVKRGIMGSQLAVVSWL